VFSRARQCFFRACRLAGHAHWRKHQRARENTAISPYCLHGRVSLIIYILRRLFLPSPLTALQNRVSVYFTSIYPHSDSALPCRSVFFHLFLAPPLSPRPISPRLITSNAPSRSAPAPVSRLLSGIISPYPFQFSDSSSRATFRTLFFLAITRLAPQTSRAALASSRDRHPATRQFANGSPVSNPQDAQPYITSVPPSPLPRSSLRAFR